jgi:hypothetical protein
MTDTLYADVSSYQPDASKKYPHQFIAFRSNDGTYQDAHLAANLAWARAAVKSGKLLGYIVYFVYETNWQQTLATFQQMVGTEHNRRQAVMIDVESWGGKILGDHSPDINKLREAVIAWLFSLRPRWQRLGLWRAWFKSLDRKRVIGYGNAGDLNTIWRHRGDASIVLADYTGNPSFPAEIAHQFSNNTNCPPFGACDMNSADGRTPRQFARQLGMGSAVWVL